MSYFYWLGYDITTLLPVDWKEQIRSAAKRGVVFKDLPRTPLNSREAPSMTTLRRGRVSGEFVMQELPWLYHLYRTEFVELARRFTDEDVFVAADVRYGIALNVAIGNDMRFECHVDSNPLEGLLFCTDQPVGAGGDLVISNDANASTVEEADRNAAVIHPVAGHLIFFDARQHPHYVRPLSDPGDLRIVAAMNYYTESSPEKCRPPEINRFLFGSE